MTEKVFRLKGNVNLWDYLEIARKKSWIAAHRRMAEVYNHWLSSPDNTMTIRKELSVPDNIKIQPEHCTIYLNILYEQARGEAEAPFNLDASIKIQRFMMNGKSRYAIIPESQGIFRDIFDFMSEDKEVTDVWFDEDALVTKEFLNENNVTEDEWVERAEIYIERLDAPHDVLSMSIVNSKIILEIDPSLDNVVTQLLIDAQPEPDTIDSETDDPVEPIQEDPQEEEEELLVEELEEQDPEEESEDLELELVLNDSEEIIEESELDEGLSVPDEESVTQTHQV